MALKSGPTPRPVPKTMTRTGFVNLAGSPRAGDTIGKTVVLRKPKSGPNA